MRIKKREITACDHVNEPYFGMGRCLKCYNKFSKFHNKERNKLRRKQAILENPQHYIDRSRSYDIKYREKSRIYNINRRIKIKSKIFDYLDNKCNYCNEKNISFLEIDHVYNDGKLERSIFGKTTFRYYNHIFGTISTGRYQLLCANCNWNKHLKCIKRKTTRMTSCEKYKAKVYDHYIRVCKCCELTNSNVLCIDHVNGGGTKLTRESKKESSGFHKWIIDNNFPDFLQVLCRNCNKSKGTGTHCSHKFLPVPITESKELMVI